MDLSTLKTVRADEGAVMNVIHPEKMEAIEGLTITLLGEDSRKAKAIKRRKEQAAIDRVFNGKKATPDAEQLDRENIEKLVALTVGWEGVVYNGEPLEFTPENARMIYSELPFLREQAEKFIEDRVNFLAK